MGWVLRKTRRASPRPATVCPQGAADEEDVALSAFDSFWLAAKEGRFPRLDDRDDLWQVLFVITTRKAAGLRRRETRAKRGGGWVVNASAVSPSGSAPDVLAAAASAEPSPDFVAQVTEECGRLLGLLGEGDLRSIALAKMEGYTNHEIARQIKRSIPTVERKLALIRKTWERGAKA